MNLSELINKFEIFIITYNRINYLKNALDSVKSQSVQGFKVTVLDNGSSDGTEVYMGKCIQKNSNINYIRENSNIGSLNIFLKAISFATKKYVLIFHDDDILHPQYVEAILKLIQEYNNIDLIYTKMNSFIEEKDIYTKKYNSITYKIYEKQDFINHIYVNKGSSHLVFPCVVYKTQNLKNLKITDSLTAAGTISDMNIVIETMNNGLGIFIENKMYNYRNHKEQESHVKKLYQNEIIANNLYFKEKLNQNWLSRMYFVVFSYYWFRNLYAYFGCYNDVTLPELFSNGYKQKAISYYTYLMSKTYGKFLIPVNYILKKILQKGRFKRLKLTLGGSNL